MPCHTFEGLMAALRPPYVSLRPHETCCCLYSPLLWAGGWFLICSVEGLQVAGPETGRLEYWESEGVLGGVLVGQPAAPMLRPHATTQPLLITKKSPPFSPAKFAKSNFQLIWRAQRA
ncbi:unnamed protein product [Gadus morhua 'NCC']